VVGTVNRFSTALATLRGVEAGTAVGAGAAGGAGAGAAASRRGKVARGGVGILASLPFAPMVWENMQADYRGDTDKTSFVLGGWLGGVGRGVHDAGARYRDYVQGGDSFGWAGGDTPAKGKGGGPGRTPVFNGGIHIYEPQSRDDVVNGLEWWVQQREERR
jgi:hypothetical protein